VKSQNNIGAVAGRWLLVAGYWSLVAGYWSLVTGLWAPVTDPWQSTGLRCKVEGVERKAQGK